MSPIPAKPMQPLPPHRVASFWEKVDVDVLGGCWAWLASTRGGYGAFYHEGRSVAAHRVAYELLVGPIPEGMYLDHLCRNKLCVNPAHLEPVTHRVNYMRSATVDGRAGTDTHCLHGHEYTPENTDMRGGGRKCRACHRDRQAANAHRYRRTPYSESYTLIKAAAAKVGVPVSHFIAEGRALSRARALLAESGATR